MAKNKKIEIAGTEISVISQEQDDYISLTDMAKSQMQEAIIIKWLSLKSTIEYIGEWEALYNPNFNYTEFGTIKNAAGSNNFVLSLEQLVVLSNLESINALLIGQKISQSERLIQLNKTAIDQMKTLVANKAIKALTIDN